MVIHLSASADGAIRKAIRTRRHACGLSQAQLADRLGIHPPAVSVWEKKRAPGLPTLVALAAIFECSMDDLIPVRR